jgi:hypothetical protein
MTRNEITEKYTDEILELGKRGLLVESTVKAALACALTEMHIEVVRQQQETLNEALSSLGRIEE